MSFRTLQLGSLIGCVIIGLFLVPWFRRASRANAMIALLSVHAARVIVLFGIPAQKAGYPLSNLALGEMLGGDLLGAGLATTSIIALLRRASVGVTLSWLVVIETILDFGAVIHRRIAEPINVDPTGPLFFVLAFFAPLCLVTLPLMVWQLVSRRREALTTGNSQDGRTAGQTTRTMESTQ